MKSFKLKWIGFLLLLFGIQVSFAQEGLIVLDSTATGQIKFAVIDENCYEKNTQNSIEFLKAVLRPNSGTDFYLYNLVEDETGGTHEKYQQTFNGVKVEFREYIVHKDRQGNITCINGDFAEIPEMKTKFATRSVNDVVKSLTTKREYTQYQAIDLPANPYPLEKRSVNQQSETVIIQLEDGKTYLTYKVNLIGKYLTDNFIAYIDIQTGNIVYKHPMAYEANYNGTAATRYSGTQTITTENHQSGYRLRETNRGGTSTTIHTRDFRNADRGNSGIVGAVDFIDNDNNWTSAEYNNARKDNAALDAHWGAEKTFDYFLSVHNRKSYDNNNGAINNYVHVEVDYANAVWSSTFKAMFYGDGANNNPYVALDIIAHEIGHGVCATSVGNGSGLEYQGESGALNESLSDIWAACVKQKMAPNKEIWLMGGEHVRDGIRSMNNPKSFKDANTYQGEYWLSNSAPNDQVVHKNSGVGNYWFYLLCQGGSGTNDKGQSYNIQGIGIDKAAKIVYRMETSYLTSRSTYADARQAAISAASSLFGSGSQEHISTQNAWYAVGVGDPYPPYINGAKNVCINSLSTYTLQNLQGSVSADRIMWSCSSHLQIQNGSTGNIKTFKGINNGEGWVKAEYNYNGIVFNTMFSVTIGIPGNPTGIAGFIEPNQVFKPNEEYSFQVEGPYMDIKGLTFNWSVSGGKITSYNGNGITVRIDPLPWGETSYPFLVHVYVSTSCGSSSAVWREGYVGSRPTQFQKESSANINIESDIIKIKIYNMFTGELIYEENNPENFNIDKTTIPKGIYIVEKIDTDGNSKTEKVIKDSRK